MQNKLIMKYQYNNLNVFIVINKFLYIQRKLKEFKKKYKK